MVKKRKTGLVHKNSEGRAGEAVKMEKILFTMPKILAVQIGKDLAVHKQQQGKLKVELNKLGAQKKKLSQRMMILKKNNTAAAKKQLALVEKSLQKVTRLIKTFTQDLEFLEKQLHSLSQKKAKYLAMYDQLTLFDRTWVKKMSKTMKGKTKPRAKALKKSVTFKTPTKQNPMTETVSYPKETQIVEVIEVPVQDRVEFFEEEPMENIS